MRRIVPCATLAAVILASGAGVHVFAADPALLVTRIIERVRARRRKSPRPMSGAIWPACS